MALGPIPSAYWASQRQAYVGSVCNAQGAVQTIGEVSVALSTLSVTIYTFVAVRSRRRLPYKPRYFLALVGAIWIWVLSWAIVPLVLLAGKGPDADGEQAWYTPTPWCTHCLFPSIMVRLMKLIPTGCWINGRYTTLRIVAEYLW